MGKKCRKWLAGMCSIPSGEDKAGSAHQHAPSAMTGACRTVGKARSRLRLAGA